MHDDLISGPPPVDERHDGLDSTQLRSLAIQHYAEAARIAKGSTRKFSAYHTKMAKGYAACARALDVKNGIEPKYRHVVAPVGYLFVAVHRLGSKELAPAVL